MADKEKIEIRVELEGDNAEKFKAVKRDLGLENNTDVIRFLITDAFKKLNQKEV